ncbi:response regulator [Patescibacteria group bacterium]|nr:response regulator [Patescibacteria group bacterium]
MTKQNKKKILWIEDEQALVNLYKDAIELIDNAEFEFMQLGQQAIDKIKEIQEGKAEKPDLILLDLLLPDVNGDKVCEVIRNTPATKDIPVFVLTNYTGEEMENKMTKDLNAEKYLVKTEWGPIRLIPFLKEKLGLK